jgi:hypothetical protein
MKYSFYKKIGILSCFIFIAAMFIPAGMAQFYGDVPQERQERQAIDYLSKQGIFRGQGDGKRFDPDGKLNRAEWAVLLTREKGIIPSLEDYGFCFPDISVEWFAAAVCYAKDQKWVQGFDAGAEAGKYLPANSLTIADVLVMLSRMQNWPTVAGETWYSGAYEHALQSKILSEALLPWHELSRAQAAEILFRSLAVRKYSVAQYDPVIAELLTGESDSSTSDQQEELSKVYFRPFAEAAPEATVAQGATNVPVLRFEIKAEEALILEELAIRRVSVGRTDNIQHARLLINGKLIKEGPFSGEREHVVWRNLSVPIEKNGLSLVEMNIDFIPEAQEALVYQFQVEAENFRFEQPVEIVGDQIKGESFKTVSIPAETITISNSTKVLRLPFIGEDQEVIGRFTLTAGNHDLLIKRIRLEDAKNVNDHDFSNFHLTVGSTEVGFIENINRFSLDFTVNDYFLEANKSRDFTVRADISESARKIDKIRLYMEDISHLHALDFDFNFGVRVINEFDREKAWCVGSNSPECPSEGLRKRCSKEDVEFKVKDCEIKEDEDLSNQECDDRLATVCGVTEEATEEVAAVKESFQNRCHAEKAGATSILPGPCQ